MNEDLCGGTYRPPGVIRTGCPCWFEIAYREPRMQYNAVPRRSLSRDELALAGSLLRPPIPNKRRLTCPCVLPLSGPLVHVRARHLKKQTAPQANPGLLRRPGSFPGRYRCARSSIRVL